MLPQDSGRAGAAGASMPAAGLTGAEVLAVSLVVFLATAAVSPYLLDRVGLPIAPSAILILSLASMTSPFLRWGRGVSWRSPELAGFCGIVLALFAWLLWIARPGLVPLGTGADLAHHLVLVDHIERHWRLVHEPLAEASMGEMAHYTPGSHLLAALLGRWTGIGGFRAVYPLLAATVALKAAFVFLIGMRLLPRDVPRPPLALTGVLLLFLPRLYFLESFLRYSFFAQVVAEMFAVVMWWALVVWDERPSLAPIAVYSLAGAAAFLTWPIWIGPPLLALFVLVLAREGLSTSERVRHLMRGATPIAALTAVYIAGRLSWVSMARGGGDVAPPALADFGWMFVVLATAGVLLGLKRRSGRATALFLASIATQSIALFALASAHGSTTPYMAIKMAHLAIYPLAVCAALAIGTAMAVALQMAAAWPARRPLLAMILPLAWLFPLFFGGVAGRQVRAAPPPVPVVSADLYRAGLWARANVPPGCVEYLVADVHTAYWLHLSVLGNPRVSPRTADDSTYEGRDAIARWRAPAGLQHAIADLTWLPEQPRTEADEVARFGSAAVLKRRGESVCPDDRVTQR